jgi:hypothetical protein
MSFRVSAVPPSDFRSNRLLSRSRAANADQLVDRLVADLRPVAAPHIGRRLILGISTGVVVSVALVGVLLGYRPDMATASLTPIFWIKLLYVGGIGGLSLWATGRLSRPGSRAGDAIMWLPLPVLVMASLAALALMASPAAARPHLIMGFSARVAPWRILAAGIPPLVGLVWAVRGLAPTRLVFAGTMVGTAAGGFGAASYAMHCSESAAPFILIWYTLGVLACGSLGAVLGPRLLRW